MRSDRDAITPSRKRSSASRRGACALRARNKFDADTERRKQRAKFACVLTRKQFGRRHERALCAGCEPPRIIAAAATTVFSAADVALQQAMHRRRQAHVMPELGDHAPLRARKSKAELTFDAVKQLRLRLHRDRAAGTRASGATCDRSERELEKRIEGQSFPRVCERLRVGRPM